MASLEANNSGIRVPRAFLTLAVAKAMTRAAEAKAREIGVPMYISVVDASANLVSINRMDGAILVSEEISMHKAYTAAAIKLPTDVVGEVAQPGASLYGIQNCRDIIIFGGGFPLKLNGEVIGGIGVSGGSVEEDMAVATAGVETFVALAGGAEAVPGEDYAGAAIGEYGVNLTMARKMADAAEKKAGEIGVPMFISLVDKGARLILTHRMEEALLVSNAISRDKAYTAAALKLPTDVAATVAQPGAPLYGLQQVDRMIIFGGGFPLRLNGKVIGGIGVSGGSVEEDMEVASAGVAAYEAAL